MPANPTNRGLSVPDVEVTRSVPSRLDESALRARKRRCLLAVLILTAVVGALEQFFAEDEAIDRLLTVASTVVGVVVVALWCQYDARERSFTIHKPLLILIILLAIVGVPMYLLLTRGMRGIVSIVLALVFFAICILVEQVAIEIVYRFS